MNHKDKNICNITRKINNKNAKKLCIEVRQFLENLLQAL